MNFIPTEFVGAWLIEPEFVSDARGSFARTWCSREFEGRGLNPRLAQCSISTNRLQGTVRGMHCQRGPQAETKLVRCTRGAIFDVIVDMRPGSPTFLRWSGIELSANNHRLLYIPAGFAHGFQTLLDESEVFYQISCEYEPKYYSGVRWDDPSIQVAWPLPISKISSQDQSWPEWK